MKHLLLCIFLIQSSAQAQELWQIPNGPTLYVPTVSSPDTPTAWVARYQNFLKTKLAGGRSLGRLGDIGQRPRILVLANDPSDLFALPEGERIMPILKKLEAAGADVFVLPLLVDFEMTDAKADVFRSEITHQFHGMLALGGDDIDPALYGQRVRGAQGFDYRRDVSELKTVTRFIESERGVYFGVCRGHQLCAVSQGLQLIQDIPTQLGLPTQHRADRDQFGEKIALQHRIRLEQGSVLRKVLGTAEVSVNSYHHQSVDTRSLPDESALSISALSLDRPSVVEAIDLPNGLGFTMQFHPELMDDEVGKKILAAMVKMTEKAQGLAQRCNQSLRH